MAAIDGRAEDVLTLPAAAGSTVTVHPNVFHNLLDPLPVRQWQVEHATEGLVVRIVPGHAAIDRGGLVAALERELQAAGVMALPIHVELVDTIAKTALGKAPLIRAVPSAHADGAQA